MFIDSSALVAVLALDEDADRLAARIAAARKRHTGAHCRVDAAMALARLHGLDLPGASALLDEFFETARITVMPITDTIAKRAIEAFCRFGSGRHAAGLSLDDCLSYACAAYYRAPILFKGRDFAKTDLEIA